MPYSDPEMMVMFGRAAERVGSSGNLHRILNPRGWTFVFSGWLTLVLRAPPQYLSSWRCIMSSLGRGWYLSLPKTGSWLVLPHHLRRWGSTGVYGDPAGGAVGCDAIMSKYHCHLSWKSVAPLPGL